MPTVDFIYDADCPNVAAARANLMRALSEAGVSPRWREHRIGDPDLPEAVRGFGSPTVLVNGRDVAGSSRGSEICCRVYGGARAPSVETITAALVEGMSAENVGSAVEGDPPVAGRAPSGWRATATVLPGLGVALLPKLTCPLCWPAYAGILGATGLTFLMKDAWLLPITALLLLAALAALAWRAPSRRGYGPALAGLGASALILLGKFAVESDPLTYAGAAALVAASVWNVWPRPRRAGCPACPTQPQSTP